MRISEMHGTITVGNLSMPGTMRLEQADRTTEINAEQWQNTLRQLRASLSFSMSGQLTQHGHELLTQYCTEETMVWTGCSFMPLSEVYRMLDGIERSIKHHRRCVRLGKALRHKKRGHYHVAYRKRRRHASRGLR